jgi:hypothetical protein
VRTRQIIPVFLVAIGLFVGTMIALGPDGDDSTSPMLSVLGPLGFHAVNALTKYWTPAEQNSNLLGFTAHLVWNRVVWLTVSAAVLAWLQRGFRFAHPDGGGRRRRRRRTEARAEPARQGPVAVPRVAGVFNQRTMVRQTLAVARQSFTEVAASRWFIVVVVACVGLTLLWGWNVGITAFDAATWPVTMLIVETVLSERVVLLPVLLITLYAGELVWRGREVGEAEIEDAAPVPDGATLLGRFLALVLVIVTIQAACMAGGILIQAFQGYSHFEPGLYLRVVFGLKLADYLLVAMLAMAIHVIVNHKRTKLRSILSESTRQRLR